MADISDIPNPWMGLSPDCVDPTLVRQLEELIRANETSCERSLIEIAEEDDIPLRKAG